VFPVDEVLNLRNFAGEHSSGPPVPWFEELAPADPNRMNTVEEIFSISSSQTGVSWSSSASDSKEDDPKESK
jgi:hypothetical protein